MQPRTQWTLDPAHTTAEFAVRHLMISTVKGQFTRVHGTVETQGEDLATAQVEVTLEASSITTANEERDTHLRSGDFLDAAQFPELTFRSREVERHGEGGYRLRGDLTIKGITRPIEFLVEPQGQVQDPWGGFRSGFTASGRLSRKDFGMTWNHLIEAGGVAVGDEVRISLEVELIREALPVAA